MKTKTLQRKKHSKLMLMPDDNKQLRFKGGIPALTTELCDELCPLYLREIGWHTYCQKLKIAFNALDMSHEAEFLMRHNIQPTRFNCEELILMSILYGCELAE